MRMLQSSLVLGALACALGWVVSPAQAGRLNVSIESECIVGGKTTTGHVSNNSLFCRFSRCSKLVTLTSDNPSVVSVPGTVRLNSSYRAEFAVTTFPVTSPQQVTITLMSSMTLPKKVTLNVVPSLLKSVRFDKSVVVGGEGIGATFDLACDAPPYGDGLRGRMNGGFTATVTTSSPAALPVDSHGSPIFLVGCRPGERTGTFFIRTQPVEANTLVFISVKGGGTTIRKSLSVTKGSLDLRIRDIEVTQAIQYLDDPTFDDNSLPLVKGKPTVVRVHLDSNTSQKIHQVSVSLKSRPVGSSQDDWTHHPPLWPRATVWSVSEITRGGHDAEYIRNYTRNSPLTHRDPYNVSFLIDPKYQQAGGLIFRAEVNPVLGDRPRFHTEASGAYDNNVKTTEHAFSSAPGDLNVKFLRIDWCPGCPFDRTPRRKPSWDTIYPIVSYLEKVFPVNRVKYWKARKEINVTWFGPKDFTKKLAWDWVIAKLWLFKAFTFGEAPNIHYYALLDERVPYTISGNSGGGLLSAGVAGDGRIAAHEIGHTLGRKHVPGCGNPNKLDRSWPYPNAEIQHTGFDVETGMVRENTAFDFMSYCDNEWVSPYTYQRLFNKLSARNGFAGAGVNSNGQMADHLIVRGVLDENGEILLPASYHKDFAVGIYDYEGEGCYSIDLLDGDGQVIRSRFFDLEASGGAFMEILPYEPETAQVDIRYVCTGGPPITMESAPVSDFAPEIVVTYPSGGESFGAESLMVSWTAFDMDDDPLTYLVLFSRDGGKTWEALDVDITETNLELDATQFPGTGQALVRVIASDGVNTAQADSGIFAIESKSPEVVILGPKDGSVKLEGVAIALRAAASDAEDGPLPDDSLTWESDLDGPLGSGPILVATLSQGIHTLTVEAIDSDGNVSTDVVAVTIIPPECELDDKEIMVDCNTNNIADACEIELGFSPDCNGNGVPDSCDIADGTSSDANADGVPDECTPPCPWDLDGNGAVDVPDLLSLLDAWGANPGGPPDFDNDGIVGTADLLDLLNHFGPCP